MKRWTAAVVAVVIVLTAALSGHGAEAAQDGAQATISALETRVSDVKATAEARGKTINKQRTQIAELRALLPVVNEDPAIGDVFAIQDFELTLQGTDLLGSVGTSGFTADANGVFLVVFLDIANVSNRPTTFPYDQFSVKDGKGRTYSYDFQAVGAYAFAELDTNSFEELQPGVIYSVAVIFDVPADSSGFTLSSTGRDSFEAPLDK